MNDKKEPDKVGAALVLIWFFGAMYATIFVVADIWETIYGSDFGSSAPYLRSILLPICFFAVPGLLVSSVDSSPSIGERVINGITWVWCFYAATLIITGVIDSLYIFYKSLKYGESHSVSTLVWLERGSDISVTWIGLRNLFSEIPVFLTFIVLGLFGIFLCIYWHTRE